MEVLPEAGGAHGGCCARPSPCPCPVQPERPEARAKSRFGRKNCGGGRGEAGSAAARARVLVTRPGARSAVGLGPGFSPPPEAGWGWQVGCQAVWGAAAGGSQPGGADSSAAGALAEMPWCLSRPRPKSQNCWFAGTCWPCPHLPGLGRMRLLNQVRAGCPGKGPPLGIQREEVWSTAWLGVGEGRGAW